MMFPYDLPSYPAAGLRIVGTSSSFVIPKSRRSVTSSVWSACPARPSGSFTAMSTSSARERRLPPWLVSRSCINPPCRSTSTTTGIGRMRCPLGPSGSAGAAKPGRLEALDAAASRFRSKAVPKDEWVRIAVSSPCTRSRAMGRHSDERGLAPPARATLVTDFYSYNTNMAADYSNLLDDIQETRMAPGCSPTGSAI